MIKGSYSELTGFVKEYPQYKRALEEAYKYGDAACGRQDIDGDELYLSIQSYQSCPYENKDFENHKKYIDIQYVVSGCEKIFLCGMDDADVTKEYDYVNDYELLKEKDISKVSFEKLNAGDFLVLFPDEPHKPGIEAGECAPVKKIVIKVLM